MSDPSEPPKPPEPTPEPPAPPDPPVTRGEFNTLKTTLDSLNASLQALASSRQDPYNTAPAYTPPREPEVTLAQAQADLAENKPETFIKYHQQEMDRMRREEVEPLRTSGAASLSAISRQTAINSGDMPYLKKIQKEVDDAYNKVPVAQRTTPDAYKAVYQFIAGAKLGEIVAEEKESAVRLGREQNPTPAPSPTPGRTVTTTPEGKTAFQKIFDDTAMQALREQGKTPDEFARKMGFKTAEEYALFAVKGNEAHA